MLEVERQCDLNEADWFFFTVYGQKSCKETLNELKYNYSLPDILKMKEYFEIQNAYEQESIENMKKQQKR